MRRSGNPALGLASRRTEPAASHGNPSTRAANMGMEMHTVALHETNTRSFVPVCSCGWIGLAHVTPTGQRKKGGPVRRLPTVARDAALVEHSRHVLRIAPGLAARASS